MSRGVCPVGSAKRLAHSTLFLAMLAAGMANPVQAAILSSDGLARPTEQAGDALASVDFNGEFLRGLTANAIDLKRFALGNPVLPGVYRAESYFNGDWMGRLDVELSNGFDSSRAEVCIDRVMVRRMYLDLTKVPDKVRGFMQPASAENSSNAGTKCLRASDISPDAKASFDPSELRLDLSVPQALLTRVARGYVPPEALDDGVRAASLEYQFNSFRINNTNVSGGATDSNYLGLTTRVNVGGGWQITHLGNLLWGTGQDRQYTGLATYARHDITAWQSNLTIGDDSTDGALFDSVRFRGITLATDERMLPNSQRGYAPVVRGQARGNAKVTVKQNGALLTEIVVPPGPFEINDLYPVGFGGDLLVTVTEADGSQQSFTVAYSAGPQLMREGQSRYNIAVGELQVANLNAHPSFAQGTLQYGYNNYITANAGLFGMQGYQQALLGGSFNTPVGAFAVNTSASQLNSPNGPLLTGNSYSASYSVLIPPTRTNFTFAAYRYNTQDYYSVSDAAAVLANTQMLYQSKLRERSSVTISQKLNDKSSLTLSGSDQVYWYQPGHSQSYQLNYYYSFGAGYLTLGANHSAESSSGSSNNRFNIGLSFPIGKEGRLGSVSTNYLHDDAAGETTQANASGTFGADNQFSYGVSAIQLGKGQSSAALYGNWRTSVGNLSVSTSQAPGSTQDSIAFNGGLVAHEGGITLAPTVGETYAIVKAEAAPGATVVSGSMVEVNRSGYAVVPYLSPYQTNTIDLNLKNVSLDVELDTTSALVAPHAGSAVAVTFKGRNGRTALITLALDDGNTIPLGASVVNDNKEAVGIVGQGGLADIRVNSDKGTLRVSWGDGPAQSCQFDYALKPRATGEQFAKERATCRLPLRDMQRAGEPANVSQATRNANSSGAAGL